MCSISDAIIISLEYKIYKLIINIENHDENIYIHFNKSTYNCKKNNENLEFKPLKNGNYEILFCFSSIPLMLNDKKNKKIK